MPKTPPSERASRRRQLLALGLVLMFSALVAGIVTLQGSANREAQARKTPLALAFEAEPQRWLAQPREASEFEATLARGASYDETIENIESKHPAPGFAPLLR